MKLSSRLTLPLLGAAVVATLVAGTIIVVLTRTTFSHALEREERRVALIVRNDLDRRAEALREVAGILATLDGPAARRLDEWTHVPVSGAAILDPATGRVLSESGERLNRDDLAALKGRTVPDGPVLVRGARGAYLAGVHAGPGHAETAVAVQRLGPSEASGLAHLIGLDIEVVVGGRATAASPGASSVPASSRRIGLALPTPGGGSVRLCAILPTADMERERNRALWMALWSGIILLVGALLFYLYATRHVTRPIEALIAATKRVADGDTRTPLPRYAPAELGALIRTFEDMERRLRESREQLVHSAKLSSVGALTAGISHELNNPLLALLGYAEVLSSRIKPGEPGRKELDIIMREGTRMKKTLADLRGLVRPDEAPRSPMDLNPLVEEVAALVRHQADQAGVAVETALAPGGVRVVAAADQVRQVIINLAVNALQAMPKGGRLRLETAYAPGNGTRRAVAAVEDNGPGVPDGVLARLTEPFVSSKPGHLGLGLAISREIAERHGGALEVSRREPGVTRAALTLPAEPS